MTSYRTVVLIALTLCACVVAAEDLERPKSIVELSVSPGQSPRDVLQQVVRAASKAGYTVSGSVQWSDGYFEAVRKQSDIVHHRVVVWMDWSLSQPGKVLRVYLMYAKFKHYTGTGWKIETTDKKQRIHATEELMTQIQRLAGF